MDLHLIPYGIIATGHEKGVIEVVQNARTVAKVPNNVTLSNDDTMPDYGVDTRTVWRLSYVIIQRISYLQMA